MPCIIRNLTDEQAITQMVEDNTNQREDTLPSERAKALKMQLEAIKHQGGETSLRVRLKPLKGRQEKSIRGGQGRGNGPKWGQRKRNIESKSIPRDRCGKRRGGVGHPPEPAGTVRGGQKHSVAEACRAPHFPVPDIASGVPDGPVPARWKTGGWPGWRRGPTLRPG